MLPPFPLLPTLLHHPKVNFRALPDQTVRNSWTGEIWIDDTFHRDVRLGSASKMLRYHYSQAYPAESTLGHRCSPIPQRAHSQLQSGSLINCKPIIGSGWATGTQLTQSDWRKGLLLHTSYEQGSRGPRFPAKGCHPTTAWQPQRNQPLGETTARPIPWWRDSKNAGLWYHIKQLITLPSGSTLPVASRLLR